MANMSYCRFQNTLDDMRDCIRSREADGLKGLSAEEREAASELAEEALNYLAAFRFQAEGSDEEA